MQKHNYIQLIETLTGSQNKALSILEKCQFPTEKDEYLKNTADFADGEFVKANDFSVDKKLIDNIINNDNNSIILVFVNGLYNNDFSKNTENINFNNIIFNNTNKYNNIFEILSFENKIGFEIIIKDNIIENRNIKIYNILKGLENNTSVSQLSNKIKIGKNCQCNIFCYTISLETEKSAFQNLYTTIDLGENSTINYHNYENINDNSSLINQVIINTSENSNAKSTMSTLNGGKIQNILYAHINKGVNFEAPGYCMPKNNQKIDNLSFITHEKGYSNSNQKFRCVADNNSFSNFYGYVEVEKDCQKVVADQINNNIILSSTAKIESKPQLIINADDVKCSHGSTTGQLNKEAIYYMQTRGISEQSAKNLLIEAFINDIINEIDNKEYGEFLKNKGFNLF